MRRLRRALPRLSGKSKPATQRRGLAGLGFGWPAWWSTRVAPGAVLGWDMGAALAMAQALGVNTLIAAELLPEIEAVMVRKLNEQLGERQTDH